MGGGGAAEPDQEPNGDHDIEEAQAPPQLPFAYDDAGNIDDNYLSAPGTDRRAQQFWGLRYIDDAIARRSKASLAGSYALPWFYITDAQFSVVAVLNAGGKLVERVRYDPYGTASHHWAGDVDGDGDEDKDDENLVTAAYGSIGSTAYNADADINRDGVVDATDLALVGKNAALAKGMISDPAGPDSPVGYCGYLFNRETGLYTVRFRHYDPGLGRWLGRDWLEYIDGQNMLLYVTGRPTVASDPLGLQTMCEHLQEVREREKQRLQQIGEAMMMKTAGTPESPGGGSPLTGEALAARLGITGETVRRWAAQGMPSCGVHPSRPSWPLYEEGACRGWAAANQPGTVLRPPAPGAGGTPGGADADDRVGEETQETMAELRSRALRLKVAHRRAELGRQIDGLLAAGEARDAWRRHAAAVRAGFGRLPGRAAPMLLAALVRGHERQGDLERLIAEEVGLALAGLDEDPLAGPLPPG